MWMCRCRYKVRYTGRYSIQVRDRTDDVSVDSRGEKAGY